MFKLIIVLFLTISSFGTAFAQSTLPTQQNHQTPINAANIKNSKPTPVEIVINITPPRSTLQPEPSSWYIFGIEAKPTDGLLVIFTAALVIVTGWLGYSTEKLWQITVKQSQDNDSKLYLEQIKTYFNECFNIIAECIKNNDNDNIKWTHAITLLATAVDLSELLTAIPHQHIYMTECDNFARKILPIIEPIPENFFYGTNNYATLDDSEKKKIIKTSPNLSTPVYTLSKLCQFLIKISGIQNTKLETDQSWKISYLELSKLNIAEPLSDKSLNNFFNDKLLPKSISKYIKEINGFNKAP